MSDKEERQLRELDQKLFVELEDWVRLLRQRIELFSVFYVFIDGLDECDARERRDLLDSLSSLATTTSGLRIFIAGRDSVRIDLKGRFFSMEQVLMTSDALASDIRLYVEATLEERVRNEDLVLNDSCLLDTITDVLTRHADGMYVKANYAKNEYVLSVLGLSGFPSL